MAFAAKPLGNATDETPVELQELIQAINALPERQRESLQPSLSRVVECSTRRRRILNLVQEALSQLRLDMKYLVLVFRIILEMRSYCLWNNQSEGHL